MLIRNQCLRLRMQVPEESKFNYFSFIEILILLILVSWELKIEAGNMLRIAWWSKVETSNQYTSYWFGPFIFRKYLIINLDNYLIELSKEGASTINYIITQNYCKELRKLTKS